jgi:quercetin dioxygenase-like cupin family protein
MTVDDTPLGPVRIVGPDEGESFWQPVPANGWVRNIFSKGAVGATSEYAMGTQTLPPGCFIREHTHARQEEVVFVLDGKGIARIDGVDHAIEKGSAIHVGMNRKHQFLNPGQEPVTFLWIMMPGGLDRFFAEIGRPRQPGESAPAPFPRPENVAEIETRTVFGWADQSYSK